MDEAKRLIEFTRGCDVPFLLVKGKIVCTRKLGARPPTSLIPAAVLRLQEQYVDGDIRKDDVLGPEKWYETRKVLRRYCLLDEPVASRPRLVTHAESCRRWRAKKRGSPTCQTTEGHASTISEENVRHAQAGVPSNQSSATDFARLHCNGLEPKLESPLFLHDSIAKNVGKGVAAADPHPLP
jgi:hypothetical protein